MTSIRLANYQQNIYRGYNKGIKNREFIPRDLMLRKVLENTRDPTMGKLGSTWEGPYRVMSIARVGAYRLENLDERLVARPWNVFNLKYYFRLSYRKYAPLTLLFYLNSVNNNKSYEGPLQDAEIVGK